MAAKYLLVLKYVKLIETLTPGNPISHYFKCQLCSFASIGYETNEVVRAVIAELKCSFSNYQSMESCHQMTEQYLMSSNALELLAGLYTLTKINPNANLPDSFFSVSIESFDLPVHNY
jgi:hypothetical protein